ncbi:uncharacterized protein BDV14DRAFT_167569 [Aspergillus stella-maris]|uniref:uncharacterized protein n=1 Tax=Aspergillus stella-maris TaxID=1810926 RepID=UPI003CCCD229
MDDAKQDEESEDDEENKSEEEQEDEEGHLCQCGEQDKDEDEEENEEEDLCHCGAHARAYNPEMETSDEEGPFLAFQPSFILLTSSRPHGIRLIK